MFSCIEQCRTPVGLVKNESESLDQSPPYFPSGLFKTFWIIGSFETDLGRLIMILALINLNAFPFLFFLRPDLSPWGYRNRCFLVALCYLIIRRSDLEVATKKLHKQVKIPGSVTVMSFMEVCSKSYCWWYWYSWGPWVRFVLKNEVWVRVTKITSMTGVLWSHSLLFLIFQMAVLSEVDKPGNFESYNSLKLSFTNIRNLGSNFIGCDSFLGSNSPDILGVCEINLDDSIDSDNFSITGNLPLIRKDPVTHMHGFAALWTGDFLFHVTYL